MQSVMEGDAEGAEQGIILIVREAKGKGKKEGRKRIEKSRVVVL